MGFGVPGRGNSQCEVPRIGESVVCSGNKKEAGMAAAEWAWGVLDEVRGHKGSVQGIRSRIR